MKIRGAFTILVVLILGWSSATAQPEPGTQLWVYDAGSVIKSSPALVPQGAIYLVAGGNVYAITNSGGAASNKWVFPMGGGESGSPAIGNDGTVYVANSTMGRLYAIGDDGVQRWFFAAGGGFGSPAIGLDNTIYSAGYVVLYAITSGGTELWRHPYGGSYEFGSPSLGADRSIYIPAPEAATLYALDSNGVERWQSTFPASAGPGESVAIGADGTIYLPADGIYAYSPSGTNLWVCHLNQFVPSSPAIGQDGTIYLTATTYEFPYLCYGSSLFAVSPSGSIKWQFKTNYCGLSFPGKTPAIDVAGMVYFTAFDTLYAVSPKGQVQWVFKSGGDAGNLNTYSWSSPAIGPDGTIYVTFGTKLYAIATGTNGPANSPWPMYRQNARHTGKVEKPALLQPKKRADANFQFQLYAQLGQTNTVEATTNFNVWTSLTSVVVTSVPMDVTDLTASNFPARLYRTSSP